MNQIMINLRCLGEYEIAEVKSDIHAELTNHIDKTGFSVEQLFWDIKRVCYDPDITFYAPLPSKFVAWQQVIFSKFPRLTSRLDIACFKRVANPVQQTVNLIIDAYLKGYDALEQAEKVYLSEQRDPLRHRLFGLGISHIHMRDSNYAKAN